MTTERDDRTSTPLQPLLHEAVVLLRAPSQLWCDETGELGAQPIHGLYHGDVRVLASASLLVGGLPLEPIAAGRDGDLLVRTDPARYDELLDAPGARPAVMGADRAMGPGWIAVSRDTLVADEQIAFWIEVGLGARPR